ncbi:FAD-dependent oxidoreductase [Streptomyces sp. H27-S2]|uniref:FAD-dependent oxidoreductase n=1 Tax=Streptomyces antarcticus TaxID=2996458 RepID=UPI00226EA045|nr:FAD-dependent oxidoreductase [Streptomyces sp. H27-S2]MCY0949862.1 FAD-dependent oxidoreductase [Streptomyces sp. H27-S2]
MPNTIAVIGAGPYGLSAAAHLRALGLPVRVFGSPMTSWSSHMPEGMILKSSPAASSLSAPQPGYQLADFCRKTGVRELSGTHQVPKELFVRYGLWFRDRLVPDVEDVQVTGVDQEKRGFRVKLSSGEEMTAAAVVVASGLTGLAHLPAELAAAVPDGPSIAGLVSHSSQHTDLTRLAGRHVVVVGAGQSALESAALLGEAGVQVRLLTRAERPRFAAAPAGRLSWQPDTPLGRSWSLYPLARQAPLLRHLPAPARLHLAQRVLGPSGAWWLKNRVAGKVPLLGARQITGALASGDGVVLTTRSADGRVRQVEADHVLAATGYQMRLDALEFLSPELRTRLIRVGGYPRLDGGFASSVPGLYFTGLAAAATFGPVVRFVCGTSVASPRLAAAVAATA